jgi:hypothetical protein
VLVVFKRINYLKNNYRFFLATPCTSFSLTDYTEVKGSMVSER